LLRGAEAPSTGAGASAAAFLLVFLVFLEGVAVMAAREEE
jgi:hypothetical protein